MRHGKVLIRNAKKPIKEPTIMARDLGADFGFSLVDEEDLRNTNYEKELEDKLQSVDLNAAEYKKRLIQTRDLVMPLLQGLTQNPEKKGIVWPNRAEKVKALIRRMNDVAGDAK